MVQAIVVESGGRISVAERDGVGCRFDVYLPAVNEQDASEALPHDELG